MTTFLDDCYRGIRLQVSGIPDTIRAVKEADVGLVEGRRLVVLTGAGDSFAVADYGQWVFLMASIGAVALSPPETHQVGLDSDCLVIGITASGRSLRTVQALEYARTKGAATVILTDNGQGKAREVADKVWLTRSGVASYDIAPMAPTTCAMVYLLGLVAGQGGQWSSMVRDDLSVLEGNAGQVLEWAEGIGKEIAEFIDIEHHLYLIGDCAQWAAAQVGMMKLNEFSLVKSTPVTREEFQHHYNLSVHQGDRALLVPGSTPAEGQAEYVRVLTDTLGMQVYQLRVPEELGLKSDAGQAIASTIAFQFGAYYAVKKHRPDMEWFKLPNAKAFKIY
jgi:fructoselysine-6-P-deglycase FrlB-like protein